jgi:hypothetical protein
MIMLHLKLLEKQELAKPKIRRRREVIKIRASMLGIEGMGGKGRGQSGW